MLTVYHTKPGSPDLCSNTFQISLALSLKIFGTIDSSPAGVECAFPFFNHTTFAMGRKSSAATTLLLILLAACSDGMDVIRQPFKRPSAMLPDINYEYNTPSVRRSWTVGALPDLAYSSQRIANVSYRIDRFRTTLQLPDTQTIGSSESGGFALFPAMPTQAFQFPNSVGVVQSLAMTYATLNEYVQ